MSEPTPSSDPSSLPDAPDLLDGRLFDAARRGDVDTLAALHLLAKRGDAPAVEWLLGRGADPNARWSHGDAEVTPLHLAAAHGHADVVRLLLAAGADPRVRDGKHDGDAMGWAEHSGQREVAEILGAHAAEP